MEKQIQREYFIQNEKEKWLKLDGIVMNILECISPAVPLQIYMDGGLVYPQEHMAGKLILTDCGKSS